MIHLRTILQPTDFSENSENTLFYAIELAKREKAKLILLHAFTISYANPFSPQDQTQDTFSSPWRTTSTGWVIPDSRNFFLARDLL